MSPAVITYQHHSARSAGVVDDLVAIYLDVHAQGDSFYSEERFRRQLTSHMTGPAWEAVVAHDAAEKVGFAYGFGLPPDTGWWKGLTTDVSEGFVAETGHRTFALSELMVRDSWRSRGIARALHDELVSTRPEQRATLLVRPDNTAARAAYERWGWTKATELRPTWENAPLYDVMMLPLVGD